MDWLALIIFVALFGFIGWAGIIAIRDDRRSRAAMEEIERAWRAHVDAHIAKESSGFEADASLRVMEADRD
jgi:hypothetical protein